MSKVITLKIEPKNKIFIFNPSTPGNPTINEYQFTAYALTDNGNQVNITNFATWESDDESIITVNSTGLGTVKKIGDVLIKVTFNGVSSTITFNSRTLLNITININNQFMRKGEVTDLEAYLHLNDGQIINGTKEVLWTSSNLDVVTITNKGQAQVLKYSVSQSSIAIRARYLTKYVETILTIGPSLFVEISTSSQVLDLELSNTAQFTAKAKYEDGTQKDVTSNTIWKTSNNNVAGIDSIGLLTGNFGGKVTVSGEYRENSFSPSVNSLELTIKPNPNDAVQLKYIDIIPNKIVLDINQSISKRIEAIGYYSNGTSKDITTESNWISSDTSIALINSQGIITAIQKGFTNISIEKDGITSQVPLEVTQIQLSTMVEFEIEPKNYLLPWNDGYSTLQYKAWAIMDDGSKIDVTSGTTWSSSNPVVSVMSINGLAMSKAKGSTTIVATYGGFTKNTQLATDANLTHIEIIPAEIDFEVNTTTKLETIAHFSNYPSQNVTNTAKWVTSNDKNISMLTNGLIHGERVSYATIRTYYYGATSEIRGTVFQAPIFIEKLSISPSNSSLALEFGDVIQFSLDAVYNDGTIEHLSTDILWEVSDSSIATIDSDGLLTSTIILKDTSIKVKATYKELSIETNLLIKPIPLPDLIPPGSITNIWEENMGTSINFIFRLPTDVDFYYVNVYRDGSYIGQTLTSQYIDTGLTLNTNYTYEFTTVDTSGNESLPVRYQTVTRPPADVNYRQPLTWSGNLSVNQNNQSYSVNSNKFPIGDVSDQIHNPYLVSWQDIQCSSCESIYQMMRDHTPLDDFKVTGWKYVTIAEQNIIPTRGVDELSMLHYMKSEELHWGAWCKECGSVIYSKVFMKEFNSRVEFGMTFFPSEQIIPKYVYKLPSNVSLEILTSGSIGTFTIYDPELKTTEELSISQIMSTEHAIMRNGEVFGKVIISPTMKEITIELHQLPVDKFYWDKEVTYTLLINKECVLHLNSVDKYDVLQVASWENKPDGTPTKLHRTYVGYNILFNYSSVVDKENNFDEKWPYYIEDEYVIPEIVPDGIRNLYGWGNNAYGQLGDGTILTKYSPVETFATDIISAAAGKHHSMAVQKNGFVLSWGRNTNGQLGQGVKDNYYHHTPTLIKDLDHMTSVDAGWFHSLALEEDGTVWSWGGNYKGQLGDGTLIERSNPIQVKGPLNGPRYLEDIIQLGAGSDFSVALDKNGNVWQWGRDILIPEQVPNLHDIIQIATGAWHTLALKEDGTVWAWGYNWSGQLGIGLWEYNNGQDVNNGYNDVIQVTNLSNITQIAAGNSHSLALTGAGTIFAWGDNEYGQVGTTINRNKYWPIEIPSIDTIKEIAAGEYSTFVIKEDNTVWSWGDNTSGVLGIGTTELSSEPQQISLLEGEIETIVAGKEHALVVKLLPGIRP